jgi:hypothetical protein
MVKQRKSRGAILGLALMAMLAFGALSAGAAQAAPQWSINGKAFAGTEAFVSQSPSSVTFDFLGLKYECDQTANGEMTGGTGLGSVVFTFSNCKGGGTCPIVGSIVTNKLKVELIETSGTVSEKFTSYSPSIGKVTFGGGWECSFSGPKEILGHFSAWLNPSQTPLPPNTVAPLLRFNGKTIASLKIPGWGALVLSGETVQRLYGGNSGKPWWWM